MNFEFHPQVLLRQGLQQPSKSVVSPSHLEGRKVALVTSDDLTLIEKFISLKALQHCDKSAIIPFNHPEMAARRLSNKPELVHAWQLGKNEDGTGELDLEKLKKYLISNRHEFYNKERFKYQNCYLPASKMENKHWGNCDEQAFYYYQYLNERLPFHINIDVVKISGGDHVFILINRPADVSINDYSKLKATLAFDPWNNEWFSGRELLNKLKTCCWNVNEFKLTQPLFDPNKQDLQIKFTRHFRNDEIFSDDNEDLLKIIQKNPESYPILSQISSLINTFYITNNLNEKIEAAEKLFYNLNNEDQKEEIELELDRVTKKVSYSRDEFQESLEQLEEYMDNFLSTFRDGNWITKSAKYPNRQPFVPFNHPEKYGVVP